MTENWTRSTYSCGANNCVEVKAMGAGVGVRDSKDTGRGHFRVNARTWQAF